MSNFAKRTFINVVGLHLGTTFLEDNWDKDVICIEDLQSFLEEEYVLTLYAIIVEIEYNKRLKFFKNVGSETYEHLLIFTKTKPSIPADEALLANIQISTVCTSAALSLYQTLNHVYVPLLKQNEQSTVQRQIVNLQNDLRTLIFAESPETSIVQESDDSISLSVINSLEHEVQYWNTVCVKSSKDRLSKTVCSKFRDILAPIAKEFSIIDALSFDDVEDLLERAHYVMDDLWRYEPPYPKDRIKNLMDIVASNIWQFNIYQLTKKNIWTLDYMAAADVLLQNISLGEKWLSTCKQLTEIFWPNHSANPWKDSYYQPSDLSNSVDLLKEVLSILTFQKQLSRLLTQAEQQELKIDEVFQCFKDADIFVHGQDMTHTLQKSRKKFEYSVQPAERRVAIKLKRQISSVNANTRQLIYEFSRYSELISRPVLKQELLTERQYLLALLFDYVKQLQTQGSPENIVINTKQGMPEVVREITQVRQLENKANEVSNVAQKLLTDLQGYEDLNQLVAEIIKDLKHQNNELFESWSSDIVSYIRANTLSLRESDPVVQFSKNKLMQVNYSPRLVELISEVRQLKAMGYRIPSIIEDTSEHAKKFMKHARILEQIANFHNTIGDRMIPCQKPMMLASALDLSNLVQEQEVVSWAEEKSVEKYVATLKVAVERLSKENNLLTIYHRQVMQKITDLREVDLIKDYSKWKEASKSIRNIMTQVEDKGFKNLQSWKNHLDKELAKVLEKQYIESLDTLHLYLPEIHIDLVYRNSTLEYNPSEENLKKIYEQQLKKFLDIPVSFRGISDATDNNLFRQIIERNGGVLENVKKHTDDLFEQLKRVIEHWQSWLRLETLETEKLTSWQHWDMHFRSSKTFGQEIAKLPSNEERVGCFVISLSRLRYDLESHNRSYWDKLIHSLKDSIAKDVVKLQDYVNHSTSALTRQPLTIEEIGESGITHENIVQEAPEMEETFKELSRKSQTLSSWTREQVEAVNRLKGAWDRLQSLLDNHQHIIAKQMDTIRTTLNIEKENLEKELERFSAKWEHVKPRPHSGAHITNSIRDMSKQLEGIKEKRIEWDKIMEKKAKLMNDFTRFKVDSLNFTLAEDIENDLKKEETSWIIFEEFLSEMNELQNEHWIVFRKKIYLLEDFLKKWNRKLLESENNQLAARILQEMNKYEEIVPFLKYVRGEDFSDKHWHDVFNILHVDPKPIDQLQVSDFLEVSHLLKERASELQAISKKAASEIIVRQALAELDQWELQARFVVMTHIDAHGKNVALIKDFKDILNKIGDHQSLLQSVKNSADYESFMDKANIWENKLGDLDHHLTALSQIQRKWLYLEPIFGSGTLALEKIRFDRIDRDFRGILKFIENDARVCALCRYQNLHSLVDSILDHLSKCQNSLDNFLKEKREKFPRFLFLSDDDLLEVIGQSAKEQVMRAHLKKIFAGLHDVRLDQTNQNIVAMLSSEGEVVPLTNPVNILKPVEVWLNILVKQMQTTLKELLVECQREKKAPDPLNYPSQILCLSENINFTAKCEQAIASMTLPPLLAKYKAQLNHYSNLELNSERNNTGADMDHVLEIKLKALLLDTIHRISVLEELLEINIMKVSDWTWQKQLRYYANSMGEVTVKMANARMEYSYEYLGNAPQLVRTTLTERCFLTLTQGMHLGMGGNPYGPAGTGKTETVKSLGGLLGRQVLVFNCDEGVDAMSMGRILSGLVKTGAWGCFDEFNRLDEATLSTISMIIQPIQVALRTGESSVHLLDQEIPVNKHCGIFVTLNPAGGDYGGRNKLPDNLKQLFRPVVMTDPDQDQIARALLHCDGYQHADIISKKLIEVFNLSSKLLSKQKHYDWGLRSVRTILSGCGRALKSYKLKNDTNEIDQKVEFGIVTQVLRTDTFSKLSYADAIKFETIINDVFKGDYAKIDGNETIVKYIEESFTEIGIVRSDRQVNKCLEFYEQLQQRMGVAIVGPPKSGKTTLRNIVLKAITKMKKTIKIHAFNPKSMLRSQLLGKMDPNTNQWNDGVLTCYSLQANSESSDVWTWIVCDGDIDPEWVESLNSVLDDNRLLSLPSGWRIQFGSNVNFIFETDSLANASPATISRMGIIFLSEEDLRLENYIFKFTSTLSETQKSVLEPLISDHLLKVVDWIFNECEITIPCTKLSVIETFLSKLVDHCSRAHFPVILINSLGQHLQEDFREIFATQVYEWTGDSPPPLILRSRYNPERDLIESYYTNPNMSVEDTKSGLPLIQTGQISQYMDILRSWIGGENRQHFLLVGPHGSAKSLLLQALVHEKSGMEIVTIHCTANSKPSFLIEKLLEHCLQVNARRGKVLKPKKSNIVLHLKNLNLLKPDKWGTNIVIEFINQLITYNGYFDSNIEFIGVENVTIVGSLMPTRNLSKRFTSNLRVFNVNLPEAEDFSIITSAYLTGIIKRCFPNQNWPKAKVVKLSTTMIAVYNKVRNTFVSTIQKHYVFSPHDLTNWCRSIESYDNSENMDLEAFLLEVIYYEALGIFGDKLTKAEEKKTFCEIVNGIFKSQWGNVVNLDRLFDSHFYIPADHGSCKLTKLNAQEWADMVNTGIQMYEREGQALNLLVTEDLLKLTAKIAKIVTKQGGHVLLVGKSGVGRRSSLKIVSALRTAKLICPMSDNQPQFNNDFRSAMQLAGFDNEEVFLQIDEHILENENNFSIINSLIASAQVPGLYSSQELDSLVMVLKDDADRENFEGTLIQYFAERVRRKLHVVVCLDKDNENIWNILQNCLCFTQNCSVIWMSDWSKETIEAIPQMMLASHTDEAELKRSCTQEFSKIYLQMHLEISTPSRYITMIKHYEHIFDEKLAIMKARRSKLQAGVNKLNEAKSLVKQLTEEAAEQQKKLAEKQSKANVALDMISHTMKNANTHKEEMESLKSKTQEENEQLIKRKKEIEIELAEVEPLIQEARSAVGNIKTESLSEIRSLRAPPEIIRDILEGVLRLMGIQDTSWNSMKTFLAKRGVKEEIRSFDASRIMTENRLAVEKLMRVKSDSFDAKSAKRASLAAAPLAAWVAANVKYSCVVDKIRPLEIEQNKLKQNLSSAEIHLGELSAGLLDVDATVANLKQQLSDYTKEAAEIEIGLKKANETLGSAEGLVSKLTDEFQRWQQQSIELSDQIEKLPKDCLLMSAFMTYLSSELEDARKIKLESWHKNIDARQTDIESFFSSEREHIQWQNEGLSTDKLSVQNAIIILKADIVPLLVDPTSTASSWIKQHLKHRNVENATQNSPKFASMLELVVRFGKVFIIEELEEISPLLLQLLRKEFISQGERRLIRLNGKLMDYHNDFKLILCSRNEQLRLPSHVAPLVNLMNFTVTHAGLTEQLITGAVKQENPELENRKTQLLREKEELEEKQDQLQNRLLEDLANSKEDILQDLKLMESLNKTKASTEAITIALRDSIDVQEKLKSEYEVYRSISEFGSSLYFACNEFAQSNVLYLLSVTAFINLFLESLQTFQEIDNDLEKMKKHLLHNVYNYMSRGIFSSDKLKFLIHLAFKLYTKAIPENERDVFLGNIVISKDVNEEVPHWLPKQCSSAVQNLQIGLPNFYETLQLKNNGIWKEFMATNHCEGVLPNHCTVTDFQKILIVQALRPDRLYSTIAQGLLKITGLKSLEPPLLNLSSLYRQSSNKEPILVLAVSGSDPFSEIRNLAATLQRDYTEEAMGEGQESKAIASLKKCAEVGTWLILKNLHLVTYWLTSLTQNLKNLESKETFRLWLISEPTPNFNFVLAQNSRKIVYETSQGLRQNILRTYSGFGNRYIEKLNQNSARIFFALSCIHALLQERRKYIPQGWSKHYDFSNIDLLTSVKLVEDLWHNPTNQIQWSFISGLCSGAVYGGRIENTDDMNILDSYTRTYLSDEILSHRWRPFGLDVSLPNHIKYEEFLKVINQLPSKDEPAIFGLAVNIDRAWEKQTSQKIITELKNLNLSKNVSRKFEQEAFQKGLAPFMNLWKKLNQGHDFLRLTSENGVGNKSAVELFMLEEFNCALNLLQMIHKNLSNLKKICKGVMVPEEKNLDVGFSLLKFKTPKSWLVHWNGPKEPAAFMHSVMNKTVNLSTWKKEQAQELLRKPMALATLFHPEAFLASHKQDYARSTNKALDELQLQTSWTTTSDGAIIVMDILIEGGIMEKGVLNKCSADSENISKVPRCYLSWVCRKDVVINEDQIKVPLYTTSMREHKVCFLQISCSRNTKDEWIQSGLAFYLDY